MPLVNKEEMKKILDDFNAKGKSLHDLELENEAKQQQAMVENANNPVLKKIWAEAEDDAIEVTCSPLAVPI